MARTVKDAKIGTRESRLGLQTRHEPYWRAIDSGMHLGYRKGARKVSWIARYRGQETSYRKKVLGTPDDIQDGNGVKILNFSQAQEKAREWFSEQARKDAGVEPDKPYSVEDAIKDYLNWFAAHRKSHRDVKYRTDAFIVPELGRIEVLNLTAKKIRDWHRDLATQPVRLRTKTGKEQKYAEVSDDPEYRRRRQHSANKVLTILKAALTHAWHNGDVSSDTAWRKVTPFKGVDVPKVRFLTMAEITRLVNACAPDFRDLVKAALLTGCRYGELISMKASAFCPDTKTVHIETSKNGKPRYVPLTNEGVVFFERQTAGRGSDSLMFVRSDDGAWKKSHQKRRMDDAAKIAKVPGTTFHILRHCYGSSLAMNGVPMPVIAAALGHSETRVTERHYAHLAPDHVAEIIRAGLPKFGIVQPSNVATLRG